MTSSLSIEPVSRVSLVETVVERIRDVIETERLQSGHRLPGELEWAQRLAVSRPVVREAVGRLQSIGLVSVSRGRGRGITVGGSETVLCGARSLRAALAVSPQDARQMQEFRTALEVHAARLAAQCATAEELADLERLAAAIARPGMSEDERVAADLVFHRRIVEITKNSVMLNILVVAQAMIAGGIKENWRRHRGRQIDTHKAHLRIIAAIRRHDPDAAQQAMFEHIQPPAVDPVSTRKKNNLLRRSAKRPPVQRRNSKSA